MTIGDATEPTLWEGQSQTLTGAATDGRAGHHYRLTPRYLYWESGLMTTRAEQVSLLNVTDVDLKASMTQKARGIGDVVVHVSSESKPVTLSAVKDPKQVRD